MLTEQTNLEEFLQKQGYLVYPNVGASMRPLLRQGKDLMFIEKKGPGRCKKYDAVLYKRGEKYILHRILQVREEDYVIVGDNCWRREFGIQDSRILGVLTAVQRGKRKILVTDWDYRLYVHLWCDFYLLRSAVLILKMFLFRALHLAKAALRKLGLYKK